MSCIFVLNRRFIVYFIVSCLPIWQYVILLYQLDILWLFVVKLVYLSSQVCCIFRFFWRLNVHYRFLSSNLILLLSKNCIFAQIVLFFHTEKEWWSTYAVRIMEWGRLSYISARNFCAQTLDSLEQNLSNLTASWEGLKIILDSLWQLHHMAPACKFQSCVLKS